MENKNAMRYFVCECSSMCWRRTDRLSFLKRLKRKWSGQPNWADRNRRIADVGAGRQ